MADGASTKVLVHALLCARDGKCSRPDCTAEVQAVKDALRRMETHAAECEIGANLPGKRGKRCERCTKWVALQKLRDRFARQLLQAQGGPRGRKVAKPSKAAAAPPPVVAPPLLKRSVTMVMSSFEANVKHRSILEKTD